MSEIVTLLSSLVSLVFCMLMGYIGYKTKLINDSINTGLSNILFYLALPCLLITSMQKDFTPELLTDSIIVFFVFLAVYAAGYIFCLIFCPMLKIPKDKRGIWQFGTAFPNVTYMGLPVISGLYGSDGIFYVTIIAIAFNLFVFTFGDNIVLSGVSKQKGLGIKHLLKNPPFIATFVGLFMFVFSIKLPESLNNGPEMLGSITMPISMVIIGASLAKTPLIKTFLAGKLYFAVFVRLILVPVIFYLILCPFISNQVLLGTITLIAAMPAASLTAIFAERLNCNTELASQYVAISTILCVITVPILSFIIYR